MHFQPQSSKPRQHSSTGHLSKALQAQHSRGRARRLSRRGCAPGAASARTPLLQRRPQSALPAWRLWLGSLRAFWVCAVASAYCCIIDTSDGSTETSWNSHSHSNAELHPDYEAVMSLQ